MRSGRSLSQLDLDLVLLHFKLEIELEQLLSLLCMKYVWINEENNAVRMELGSQSLGIYEVGRTV
jgi:hypothetical protein